MALAGELSGSPQGEGIFRGGLYVPAEAQACTGMWGKQWLATQNRVLSFTGLYVHKPELGTHPDAAHLHIPHKSYALGIIF